MYKSHIMNFKDFDELVIGHTILFKRITNSSPIRMFTFDPTSFSNFTFNDRSSFFEATCNFGSLHNSFSKINSWPESSLATWSKICFFYAFCSLSSGSMIQNFLLKFTVSLLKVSPINNRIFLNVIGSWIILFEKQDHVTAIIIMFFMKSTLNICSRISTF